MQMDTGGASSSLSDLRQHAATIKGQVSDFHTKFEQFEQTLKQRFTELQQAESALVQHIQEERDRARQETQALLEVLHGGTDWLHQSGMTLQNGTTALTGSLSDAEHGAETGSTQTQQASEHVQTLTQNAQEHYQEQSQQLSAQVDAAHDKAHEDMISSVAQMQESVSSASDQNEQAIDQAHQELQGQQTEAHSHFEQVATQATQQMHARGGAIHQHVSQEVDGLSQHQDQHHQELSHQVDQGKQDLTQVGSTVTDTAHGIGDGVDGATLLLQQTNLGVQEVLTIIQNIEQIFQEIVGKYNS